MTAHTLSPARWAELSPLVLHRELAHVQAVGLNLAVIVDESFESYVVVAEGNGNRYSDTFGTFAEAWALLDATLRHTSPELFPIEQPVASVEHPGAMHADAFDELAAKLRGMIESPRSYTRDEHDGALSTAAWVLDDCARLTR